MAFQSPDLSGIWGGLWSLLLPETSVNNKFIVTNKTSPELDCVPGKAGRARPDSALGLLASALH